ncbi:MAG: phospholipase D-like domain-containing protein [Janthinobacterium lividum]
MPHPLRGRLVPVLVGLVLALVPLLVAPGSAAAAPAPAPAPASTSEYLYSTPVASAAGPWCRPEDLTRCTLGNDLIRRIDAVPLGGRIDVVMYSTTRDDLAQALVAAAARGVFVRMLTSHPKPDGEKSGDVADKVQGLVDRLRLLRRPVKVGWGSLSRAGRAGIEHRKLVLIDPDPAVDGDEQTISDSGNWTYSLDTAYNDRTVVTDRCLYVATRRHLDVLWKDRAAKKISPLSTCDERRRLWMMPEVRSDPVLTWAKAARCGPGSRVTFANFYLSPSKAGLVDQLIRFRRAGAYVQVAANDELTGHYSTTQKRRMVAAGIKVFDVSVLLDPRSGRKVYDHQKSLAATGCGPAFSAQGSTTQNTTAYTKNGNAVLTSTVYADAEAMQAGFEVMVADAHRLTLADLP